MYFISEDEFEERETPGFYTERPERPSREPVPSNLGAFLWADEKYKNWVSFMLGGIATIVVNGIPVTTEITEERILTGELDSYLERLLKTVNHPALEAWEILNGNK